MKKMKFISNVKGFYNDPESGTIFSAEIDGMTISVHKLLLADGWFLTCNLLGVSCYKLKSDKILDAIEESKQVLKERVNSIQKTVDLFSSEPVMISKY